MKASKAMRRKAAPSSAKSNPEAKLKRLIHDEIAKLEQDDKDAAAVAAASLAMLAQNSQGLHPELLDAIPKLTSIISSGKDALQRNATVALISIVHIGVQPWKVACDVNAVSLAVGLLNSPKQDPGLRVNAAVLAGALIEGGESGPDDFYKENGVEALLPILSPETDAQLLEAGVDIICKLASVQSARQTLAESGVVKKLAGLLGLDQQTETQLRILMGIAMLLDSSPGQLNNFADTPKAIDNLAATVRNSKDPDIKAIATSIFANLANDPATREAVTKALQARPEENKKA